MESSNFNEWAFNLQTLLASKGLNKYVERPQSETRAFTVPATDATVAAKEAYEDKLSKWD